MNTLRLTTLALGLMVSGIAEAQTYVVDRYQDDSNKGSLRWAIEQANANPSEASEILIQAVGKAPYAIKLNSALPEIKAPVKIIVLSGIKLANTSQLMVQTILKAKVQKLVQVQTLSSTAPMYVL